MKKLSRIKIRINTINGTRGSSSKITFGCHGNLANYMYSKWNGIYKKFDKAEKYPSEGMFIRSTNLWKELYLLMKI